MVNNYVVQGCVVGTAKQNVTLCEFPKASWQDASYGGVSYRRLEATVYPTRHSLHSTRTRKRVYRQLSPTGSGHFHNTPQCDVTNPLGGAFNLAVKIVKVVILKA